ncbi:hypothetical protein WJX77_008059 [Trebouxia sp. C0004]
MHNSRTDRSGLTILYGSQTGNAQDVAERIGREGKRRHFVPRIMAMDAFPVSQLPEEHNVILVSSTTGQGEVPSNMKAFWKFLLRKALPADSLKGIIVAVFGLGDSGYQNYNTVAKKLDRRLTALGASVICERGLGDDQHPNGYEAALDPWLQKLWSQLRAKHPLQLGLSEPAPEDTSTELEPKYQMSYLASHEVAERPVYASGQEEAVAAAFAFSQLEASVSGVHTSPGNAEAISRQGMTASTSGTTIATENAQYGLWRPFMASLTCNTRITSAHHFQDTRHLEFDLTGSGMHYAPGDLLTIFPCQSQAAVSAFLQRMNLDPDAWVRIQPAEIPLGSTVSSIQVRVGALVRGILDISGASPRRYFFEVLQHFATAEVEVDRLEYFATPEGRNDLYTYNQKEGRTVLEVLQDFKSAQPPLEWLLQTVPHLKPRQFSSASSLAKHPNSAHVLMAVVNYETPFKRRKQGLCSAWLASLTPLHSSCYSSDNATQQVNDAQNYASADAMASGAGSDSSAHGPAVLCSSSCNGDTSPDVDTANGDKQACLLPVWVEKGGLRLPASHSTPMILIGAGTGVAPFRSFLEERQMAAAGGASVAPSYLLFGCRGEKTDFYYNQLWQQLLAEDVLAPKDGLLTAFSRDQKQKVYVQDKLRQHSKLMWDLLQQGAVVYVSGSAEKMPQAVATAFEEIAAQQHQEPGFGRKFVQRLEHTKRYHVEAWS